MPPSGRRELSTTPSQPSAQPSSASPHIFLTLSIFTREPSPRCHWHHRSPAAINSRLWSACSEVVCVRRGVVSTTLARDSKVTRWLLCSYYRGFRISKTTTEPQFEPSITRTIPNIIIPRQDIPILTSTTPTPIPNLKCFCCEDHRRLADRT